ncbi:MAG: hypothetical protein DHS20C01_19440 [marine bacterium B5-7]|nr:MAG: hypothetical protein DHS20C01_19440 [marine bacterium B5-7]
MELNAEDALRLQVLIARSDAIRIDEATMTVYGLGEDTEHMVRLNVAGQNQRYLKKVRELLSSQAIDSPSGYPGFLSRWTRMRQVKSNRLNDLLKLGEPEAVIAVAAATTLDPTTAAKVWWAYQSSETARFLLEHDRICEASIGQEVADYLLEFLPFETEYLMVARDTALILKVASIDGDIVNSLWRRAQRKTSILLGFLMARPLNLPPVMKTGQYRNHGTDPSLTWNRGTSSVDTGNDFGNLMPLLLDTPGQQFCRVTEKVLTQAADQEIVSACLGVITSTLAPLRPPGEECASIDEIHQRLTEHSSPGFGVFPVELKKRVYALRFLSMAGDSLIRDYCVKSSAVGSLMRKQLAPVLDPVCDELRIACGGQ